MAKYETSLLVGCTGFVGNNLMMCHKFQSAVHSTDVNAAFGSNPDLCVYAGVPSAMFLANRDPKSDLAIMMNARENLRRIAPRKVVLISTIAVYEDSRGKDETSSIDGSTLPAYGKNRLQLEKWVREDFPNALVIRLPALYGKGIKKNFIKDMISVAPPLLKEDKYLELAESSPLVRNSYDDRGDGFYTMRIDVDAKKLREWFTNNDFNALSFTDSRSRFQFYGLDNLWPDITTALANEWETLNLATPPISAAELYYYVHGSRWTNELEGKPFDYDMRTVYDSYLGGEGGYICSRSDTLHDVKVFVREQS